MNRKEFKKLLIEWNQLLCEGSGSESKILYYGSPHKFDKFETKSHFLAGGTKWNLSSVGRARGF